MRLQFVIVSKGIHMSDLAGLLGVPRGWMGMAYANGLEPEPDAEEQMSEQDRRQNLFRHAATVLFGQPIFGRVTTGHGPGRAHSLFDPNRPK
jgi:hypothetical protein